MKNIIVGFVLLGFCACNSSKNKTVNTGNGASLEHRLTTYLQLTDEMNMDKAMDYIYPKLFTIASREAILKAMKDAFNSGEIKTELDSLKIEKIYPVFEMANGSYAKVDYSMIILMEYKGQGDPGAENDPPTIKDTAIQHSINSGNANAPGQTTMIKAMIAEKYGDENVSVDEKTGIIKIRSSEALVAVKDEYAKEWSFVSYKEEDPMTKKLFSKEVLDKLATYK